MKRTLRMLLAALLLAMLTGATCAQADTLKLPSNTKTIKAEAFYGDSSIDQLVTLPGKVTTVGANAFYGTHVFAIDFPASVTSIADQNLSSTYMAYAIVRNSSATIASTALNGAKYIFGNSGSTAQTRASADGITFVPLSQLVLQNGFYYQITNSKATLLCPKNAPNLSGSVTIPQTVSGYPVSTISKNAFFRCSRVTALKIPSTATVASGALSGAPNATVTYYGGLDFSSVTVNRTWAESEVDSTVKWTANCSGGTGSITYKWEVLQNGSVVSTTTTTTNTLSYSRNTTSKSVAMSVRVTATDSLGNTATITGGSYTLYPYGGAIPGRTYRALIIANDWSGSGSQYRPSMHPSAKQFRNMLNTMSGTPYKTTVSLDRTATQTFNDISSVLGAADSNDISIFCMFTHGSSDGKIWGDDGIGSISPTQLRNALDQIPGRKIVIIDACYSGNMIGKSADGTEQMTGPTDAQLQSFNSQIISAFRNTSMEKSNLATSGYFVMTAATGTESSWSYNDGSGSVMFIELLRGCGWSLSGGYATGSYGADTNSNGVFTLNEVATYTAYHATNNHYGYEDGVLKRQHLQVYPSGSPHVLWSK